MPGEVLPSLPVKREVLNRTASFPVARLGEERSCEERSSSRSRFRAQSQAPNHRLACLCYKRKEKPREKEGTETRENEVKRGKLRALAGMCHF